MSLLSKTGLRRGLLSLAAFAAVSALAATPAFADHYRSRGHRHGRGHFWHPPLPRVVVGLPLPPVVIVAGPRARDYGYYEPRYDRSDRAYDRGYEDGYEDGYDDRDREEWRRDRYRRSRHDCDRGYY